MNKQMLNNKPLVSVVIPSFNRGYIISRSIDSVLNQTYRNLELLIVDDCSTDDTEDIVKGYNDYRIRYIKQDKNQGANVARNRGIKEAKGEYVAFQDSDDVWLQNKLEVLIGHFMAADTSSGAVFSKTRGIKFDGSSTYYPLCKSIPKQFSEAILQENYVCTVSLIVRKDCLDKVDGFDEKLPRLQDWDLAIRLSKITNFLYVNEPLVDAYHQEQSISADGTKLIRAINRFSDKYNNDIKKLIRSKQGKVYNKYGSMLCREGMVGFGRNFLVKSFYINPSNAKNILQLLASLLGNSVYRFLVFRVLKKKLL